MTPEQFQQFLKSNEEATGRAIEVHVNGKIRNIDAKLDKHITASQEHWDRSNKFMAELQPVREGLITVQAFNKFLKWLGIPSLVAFLTWFFMR